MLHESAGLPFFLGGSQSGLTETEGLMHLEPEALVLEFQNKDAILGLIRSGVKTVRLGFDDLVDVAYAERWFRAGLEIRVRKMALLGDLPGSRPAEVWLRVRRKHRGEAKSMSTYLRLKLSEYRLRQLEAADDEDDDDDGLDLLDELGLTR